MLDNIIICIYNKDEAVHTSKSFAQLDSKILAVTRVRKPEHLNMSPVSMSPSTSTSSSRPAASSSGSSKLRLRQTARPSELILLAVTQLLSVAYAVVVLPSRSSVPAFLPELSDILDPYIVNAPLALVWSCAGLAVVQTYTGYRFAVWSGRVTPAEGANDPPLLVWSKVSTFVEAALATEDC